MAFTFKSDRQYRRFHEMLQKKIYPTLLSSPFAQVTRSLFGEAAITARLKNRPDSGVANLSRANLEVFANDPARVARHIRKLQAEDRYPRGSNPMKTAKQLASLARYLFTVKDANGQPLFHVLDASVRGDRKTPKYDQRISGWDTADLVLNTSRFDLATDNPEFG